MAGISLVLLSGAFAFFGAFERCHYRQAGQPQDLTHRTYFFSAERMRGTDPRELNTRP